MDSVNKLPAGNSRRPRRRNPVSGCPLTAALSAIGGKWKLIILYWLAESPMHLAALRKAMPRISAKVLTEQLRELMSDQLVRRRPSGKAPARVEYSLTEYGRSVLPLVSEARRWGKTHIQHLTTLD
jgi:DNA-binding HxlR family transcriptional regulator